MSNQNVHIIFGEIEKGARSKFDKDEVKEVRWLPLDEVKTLIKNNKINDGMSILSLLLLISGMAA